MNSPTILITGANRGLGLELCRQFLADGWRVIACCRAPETATDLLKLADNASGNLEIEALHVSDGASVEALRSKLEGRRIDVLLNNAGMNIRKHQTLFDIDYDVWLETFKVNTMAPLRMVQGFIDNLRLSDNAKIINISSQVGSMSMRRTGSYAYDSSKSALNRVMLTVAENLKDENIAVSLIHPGWVRTDMGGSDADISVEESGAGIFKLTTRLTMADSGKFFKWNGEEHAW